MGHIKKHLNDAIKLFDDLRIPESEEPDEELVKANEETYNKISDILDQHIFAEEKEEVKVNDLINALDNYKKHLKFARMILDKDFSYEGQEQEKELEKITKRKPDFYKDIIYTKKQIKLAQDEWKRCKKLIKDLLGSGKIKLE